MEKVTAILISFLRPYHTILCASSLKSVYPEINIIVAENAKPNKILEKVINSLGGEYIQLPYDSGVCIARNKAVAEVDTKYVLIGDDDFFYSKDTGVEKMVAFLERHPEIDLIGGRVREKGEIRNYQGTIDVYEDHLHYHSLDENYEKDIIRYKPADITFNFFVARTDVIKKHKWDENIKVSFEHSDWFIGLKKVGVRCAFTPDIIVDHKKNLNELITDEYNSYRLRRSDQDYFVKKHNIKYSIGLNGKRKDFN